MGAVNLVVIVESMRTIATHKADEETNPLHVPSLIAVAAALGKMRFQKKTGLHADVHPRRQVCSLPLLHTPSQSVEPS